MVAPKAATDKRLGAAGRGNTRDLTARLLAEPYEAVWSSMRAFLA